MLIDAYDAQALMRMTPLGGPTCLREISGKVAAATFLAKRTAISRLPVAGIEKNPATKNVVRMEENNNGPGFFSISAAGSREMARQSREKRYFRIFRKCAFLGILVTF